MKDMVTSTPPEDYESLRLAMSERHRLLSKRLQQLAEFALDHPTDMALRTVAQLAAEAGVQPSTLIRFAKAFGYDGFSAMQQVFQGRLTDQRPSYSERIRALRKDDPVDESSPSGAILDRFSDAAIQAIQHLRMEVTAESLEGPADILAKAERIHIVGSRRAYPVATYLTYALAQLGLKVHLLDGAGGMLTQQATAFEKDDVLIAISFQPYAPETVSVAAKAQEAGMQIVAITDGPLSPLLHMAAASFEIEETSVGAFRALSATMCLALALVVTTGEHADLKSDMSSLLS